MLDDPPAANVDDRLGEQTEPVVGERAADAALPLQHLELALGALQLGLEGGDVAEDDGPAGRGLAGGEGRQRVADAEVRAVAPHEAVVVDAHDVRAEQARRLQRGLHIHEGPAAAARRLDDQERLLLLRLRRPPAQQLRRGVVHVRHPPVAVERDQPLPHAVGDRAQVALGCEQPLLALDPLGDVDRDADEARRAPVLAGQPRRAGVDVKGPPRAIADLEIAFPESLLGGHAPQLVPRADGQRADQEVGDPLPDGLDRAPSEEPLGTEIPVRDAAVHVRRDDGGFDGVEQACLRLNARGEALQHGQMDSTATPAAARTEAPPGRSDLSTTDHHQATGCRGRPSHPSA